MTRRRKNQKPLSRGCDPGPRVLQLQRGLRRLGYLGAGLDGTFGPRTEAAVRALQIDLLENDGGGPDGAAPVSIASYNRQRVAAVDGEAGEALADCMRDMLADERLLKIPASADPPSENAAAVAALETAAAGRVPAPFLRAIIEQESGGRHYHEPTPGDPDNYLVIGLDRNVPGSPRITSRGYGIAQVTLFHHPPSKAEVDALVANPAGNLRAAVRLLREKFDKFVNGATTATRADDRVAEVGTGPLRLCRYLPGDPRHLTACRQCVAAAGLREGTPDRARVGCDWPYAVRRYNGSGPRSYEYQARILARLLNG